ncbi:hypothetical protein AB835_11405 [Candidatus Endobugula sertula]|uniref:Uncharacterized protein n=1 Tax=Candidatus Endobugula sertula TaxID=62101 RepID=A0A1D2QN09_9GAMM|nr:hypothetical protein AB835_11405 [Candidatus Endobugula sertula]
MSRYVPFPSRQKSCGFPVSCWRQLTECYAEQHWKGVHIDKSPFELALYPMLIHEFRFSTIIEIGSGDGGSALWLADMLDDRDECQVISLDIDDERWDSRAVTNHRIQFICGDCYAIEDALPIDMLAELTHPLLVIEDAHVNLAGVLSHLDKYCLKCNDYLIIEDTNLDICDVWSDWPDKAYLERLRSKYDVLAAWLDAPRSNRYLVDSFYLDLFGYNTSKQWNSIFRVC